MSCRRICRELLWLARFGELGPSSQPHLEHLAECSACRDEVGYDRAMVQQLRTALAERIESMTPSPEAWERIRSRAQAPEPVTASLWTWSTAILGRLRTATAMAGTGLALILAMNMEVVPVAIPSPDRDAAPAATSLQQVPRIPTGRTTLAALALRGSISASARPDPESLLTKVGARLAPRPMVPAEEPIEGPVTRVRVSFRALGSPEPTSLDEEIVVSAAPTGIVPIFAQPGEPS